MIARVIRDPMGSARDIDRATLGPMRTRVVLAWVTAAWVFAGVVAVAVIPPVPGLMTNHLV